MNVSGSYATDVDAVLVKYADTVYKIALARTGNSNDADDVFQEVFLRLIKHIDRLSSDEHIKYWLIRVTINCCKRNFKLWNNKTIQIFDPDAAITSDEYDVLQTAMQLPAKYRAVVHLFYYEQFSVRQISEILKITETAVKTRLFRAREMLRKTLEGDIGYEF